MLFPCLQKQQRSLDPQDQTQKRHHMDESDLQMWNRSKLNCKSVMCLWLLSCRIEINITFTNTFCIVLQKWKWILQFFFFLCRRTWHLSNHGSIAFAQMSFLNLQFPDQSLANSITAQGGGNLLGKHHSLPQGTQFGPPWAQCNLVNLHALVSFPQKLQLRKSRACVHLCPVRSGMWAPPAIDTGTVPASGLTAKACHSLQSVICTKQNWSLQHFVS